MIAAKIFNNNALATVTDEGQDAILIGLWIGFNKRPGDKVNQDKIEKNLLCSKRYADEIFRNVKEC